MSAPDDIRKLLHYRYNGQVPCGAFVPETTPDPDLQQEYCETCKASEPEHVIYQLATELIWALTRLEFIHSERP